MLYPSAFEQKLGFDSIRRMISGHCLSTLGQRLADQIGFSSQPDEISRWLSETAEMKMMLQFEERFPAQDYYDLISELLRIRIPGTFIETEQLSELRLSLISISNVKDFITRRRARFPYLNRLIPGNQTEESAQPFNSGINHIIINEINRILNEKSEIRDTASPELQQIRREMKEKTSSVERRILQSFKLARQNGWIPEDAEVTIRNGRLVIPMMSSHKRKIQGFVHDESSTGHTVYVEPADIFETNNEIRELGYAERREIVRILTEFTSYIRPDIDDLVRDYHFLGTIDFLRAKAMFAIDTEGVNPLKIHPPEIPLPGLNWRRARHPLLAQHLTNLGRAIVPLDISLNHDHRILVISGPNAGGKSVCLKTVGLLQYMYQCGLLPPVREDSEFGIFKNIFIDIGDEQSIDNDLSTYTSKLRNLKFFIENIDQDSLFLIDELGTGTDPTLGGAIAEATLESLNKGMGMGVVTTHYSNLKLLAGREPGIINGAMLFDLKKLKPLYQLMIGKPGSSFAFEIAGNIGFPDDVLQAARAKTGTSQLDFDRELQNLEVEKSALNKQSESVKVADEFLSELIAKYEKLTADLEKKKKDILEKAQAEAEKLLWDSNKIIEKTIKEIRESQAEKNKTKEIRQQLTDEKNKLLGLTGIQEKTVDLTAYPVTHPHPENGLTGMNPSEKENKNIISKKEKKEPLISAEIIGSKKTPHRYQNYINELQSKLTSFSLTLDLRGMRVDEALAALQRYIDDAMLLSIHEVRILHGKGNGVLRQVTRDYLRSQKEVKSAKDAHLDQGGSGITIVIFH